MKFNRPDPQALIDINRIQNLEYVKLYDLNDVNTARDQRTKRLPESNNNKILIPALMVTYDNGKNMCMDAHDEYFMDFLFKVLEVYREEQNSEVFIMSIHTHILTIIISNHKCWNKNFIII